MTVDSDSSTEETQAGAGVRGTSAGAGTQAAGAGAGTSSAGAGSQGRLGQQETAGDINQTEAYTLNLKHRVDQSLEDDARLRAIGLGVREASAAAVANTITGAANALNQLMTAGSTNTLSLMSAVQETAHKTVRTGLFEIDKLENIDEVNAYASILAAAIARELNRDKSE